MIAMTQLSFGRVASVCTSLHGSPDKHAPSLTSVTSPPGESHSPEQGDCQEETVPAHPENQAPCGGGDMSGACIAAPSCVSTIAELVMPTEVHGMAAGAVRVPLLGAPLSITTAPESPPPRA